MSTTFIEVTGLQERCSESVCSSPELIKLDVNGQLIGSKH